MSDQNTEARELIVASEISALDVFTKGLQPVLERIKSEVSNVVGDVSTKKGRDEIAARAYRVAQAKTLIEKIGKKLKDDASVTVKQIDASRKTAWDFLETLQKDVRAPLNEWEANEAARVKLHKDIIGVIEVTGRPLPDATVADLEQGVATIGKMYDDHDFEEFKDQADVARDVALANLDRALESRRKYEADQAELEHLRAQNAEKEAAEKAAADAKQAEEDEAKRLADIEAAAAKKVEDDKKAEEEAAAKRQADVDHKAQVDGDAAEAIAAVLDNAPAQDVVTSEEWAKMIVKAISLGQIPNVVIKY